MLTVLCPLGRSIRSVIDSLPSGVPATIQLAAGVYREKLLITRPNLTIRGESQERTAIEWDDYAEKLHPADGKAFNTFRTYTVQAAADHLRLESLAVRNTAGNPSVKGQSVALSVYGNDFSAENCLLSSTQDTLFCGPLPDDLILRYDGFLPDGERYFEGESLQIYRNCRIEGSVDFVFGCGNAWFLSCELCSVNDGRDHGFVAAPAHALKQRDGFVFLGCSFTGDGCGEGSVYLARPWRDFGKCAFVDCMLSTHIAPTGFDPWNDTGRDRTARFSYSGLTGSSDASFVPWAKRLTSEEAYTLRNRAQKRLR